jgi:hypothetical protein
MKRITLVLGVVAVMVVMLVALAAPAMAKGTGHNDNGNHNNTGNDSHLDRQDVSFDRHIVNNDHNFGFEGNRDFAFANDGFFFSPFIFDDSEFFGE